MRYVYTTLITNLYQLHNEYIQKFQGFTQKAWRQLVVVLGGLSEGASPAGLEDDEQIEEEERA